MAAEESWGDIAGVAVHLHLARDTVYRWVDTKGMLAHLVGRLLRFRLSEVNEWVNSGGGNSEGIPASKTANNETNQ